MERKYSSNGRLTAEFGTGGSNKSTTSWDNSSSSSAKLTRAESDIAQHKHIAHADSKLSNRGEYGSVAKSTLSKEIDESPSGSNKHLPHRMLFAEEKEALDEIQEVIEADEEFEKMKNTPTVVEPAIAKSLFARRFVRGFRM